MGLFGKAPDVKQMRDSRDIEGLIKALKNLKEQVRRQAAQALGELKDARSIEPLLASLGDRSDEVRGEAMGALSGMWDERMGEAFVPILSDKNSALAKRAAAILDEKGWKPKSGERTLCLLMAKDDWADIATQGDLLVEPLVRRLADPNVDAMTKYTIAITLSYIDTPLAVQSLTKLTRDSVFYALMALENKTAELDAAVEYILDYLRNSAQFGGDAVRTLMTLGTVSLGRLSKIVMADKRTESLYGRIFALRAVACILAWTGDAGARDILYRIPVPSKVEALRLDQITHFPEEEHGFHLWTAVFRRVFENPPESLIAAAGSHLVSARTIGIMALGNYPGSGPIHAITSGLKDSSKEVLYMTCLTLGKIGSEEAVLALSALSGHENENVRMYAARALGSCAGSAAAEALSAMVGDNILPVRAQAMLSLAKTKNLRI
ncbi:MAG: HEAT repeat domain-containing protein [Clostridiaceae bacterium]|nr:HEAT repeat domain-containing protein [Clostridiaceae bacterium]